MTSRSRGESVGLRQRGRSRAASSVSGSGPVVKACAAYDWTAEDDTQISFAAEDTLTILSKDDTGWWYGQLDRTMQEGYFPANYVEEDPALGTLTEERPHSSLPGASELQIGDLQFTVAGAVQIGVDAPQEQTISAGYKTTTIRFRGSDTRYGRWALQMGKMSSLWLLVFGLCGIFWFSRSRTRDDNIGFALLRPSVWPKSLELVMGFYACIVSVALFVFESRMGEKRSSGEKPWRSAMYFLLAVPCFLSLPTFFGGVFLLMTSAVHFMAFYKKEHYEPRKRRAAAKKTLMQRLNPLLNLGTWWKIKKEEGKHWVVIFSALYSALNFVAMIWYYVYHQQQVSSGESNQTHWIAVAKLFGMGLDINCSFMLFPVARTFIRYLYNISTRDRTCFSRAMNKILKIFPLDHAIEFHKIVAAWVLTCTVGHVAAHILNYGQRPFLVWEVYELQIWFTGVALLILTVIIFSAAVAPIRRGHFELFWYSHHCFILYYFFNIVHGKGFWGPNFWKFFLVPGVTYTVERCLREFRSRQPAEIKSVTLMDPNVYSIEFAAKGAVAEYREGQYFHLKCPHVSKFEWHPFTISSSPYQDNVTCHILSQGPGSWTQGVKNYLSLMGKPGQSFIDLTSVKQSGEIAGKTIGPDGQPIMMIDGPHSAPTQHIGEYQHVMVAGAGIGVTPLCATMKSIVFHRWKYFLGQCYPSHAHFYWVCSWKVLDNYRWFMRTVKEVCDEVVDFRTKNEASYATKSFKMHIYITSVPKGDLPEPDINYDDDVSFWGSHTFHRAKDAANLQRYAADFTELDLYRCAKCPKEDKVELGDLVVIYKGRPAWDKRFDEVAKAHPSGKTGVMYCGNPFIAASLQENCTKYSDVNNGRLFRLHKENF